MTQDKIPDFTETEVWIVRQTLTERYGHDVELQLGDAEVRLQPEDRSLTTCPVVFWRERGAGFAIFKTGRDRFRAQFFYRGFEQFGTGKQEFDELGECVITVLQVQSDHERTRALNPEPERKAPAGKPGTGAETDTNSDMQYYWGD